MLPVPRMLHFFDPSNERMRSRLPQLADASDVLVGNLEDAIPLERKAAAREGLRRFGGMRCFGESVNRQQTQLWARLNALESPWFLDDLFALVGVLDVVMLPKVEGDWDIHYTDRLLSQLEQRHGLTHHVGIHAILETSIGMVNVEEIACASPRMQGISFGPGDLAASRRMKTTRIGGPHPDYRSISDPATPGGARARDLQDPWHYSIARMVDACVQAGILPFYGPFGDIADAVGCESQMIAARALGCVGAWSLHPTQIEIAKRVFTRE